MGTIIRRVTADKVTVSAGTAAFADKNAGIGKLVTFTDFSLTGEKAGNYQLSAQPVSVTADITPKDIMDSVFTLDAVGEVYKETGYAIHPIVCKINGVNVSQGTDYTLAGDTSGTERGTYTLQVNGTGNYTGTAYVSWRITDSRPPTGSVSIKEKKWTSFWNVVTFGLFFQATQTVTVEAEDAESGIDKVYYYISATVLADTAEAEKISDWTEVKGELREGKFSGSFRVKPDKGIVYVKITDLSGNVTYINSDGLIIDSEAPKITGIINGAVYCAEGSAPNFSVSDSDSGVARITVSYVEGETRLDDIYDKAGTYSLKKVGRQIISAEDKVGNYTFYVVSVYDGHEYEVISETESGCVSGKIQVQKCKHCGYTVTETDGTGEHQWEKNADGSEKFTVDIPATCTTVGSESVHCTRCNAVKDSTEIPARGHQKGDFVCGSSTHYHVCTVCKAHVDECSHVESEWIQDDDNTTDKTTVEYTYCLKCMEQGKEVRIRERMKAASDAGALSKNVEVEPGAPEASTSTSLEDLKKACKITDVDLKTASGSAIDIDITLKISPVSESDVNGNGSKADDATEITELANKLGEEVHVKYFEVTLEQTKTETETGKKLATETIPKVEENQPITITIEVPAEIRTAEDGMTRTFYILHRHEDEPAEKIECEYNESTGQLTFKTYKFSTYAIAYADAKKDATGGGGASGDGSSSGGGGWIPTPTPAPKPEESGTESSGTEDPGIVTEYTITFDANGGTVGVKALTTVNGRLEKLPTPNRAGYTFNGWYTKAKGGTKITTETVFAKDRTVYAHWTKNVFIVKGTVGAKDQIKLTWKTYRGAEGYVVYGSICDGKSNFSKYATTKKLSYTAKNLNAKKSYKFYVIAYKMVDGKRVMLAKSPAIHVSLPEKGRTGAKSIEVDEADIMLETKKTWQIKAKIIYIDKKKALLGHAAQFRFLTSNKAVATVDKNGKITAQGRGTCYIYVVAENGVYKKLKVTVK